MNMTSIGDMSLSLLQRTRVAGLKQSMAVLVEELSTGEVSDPSRRLGGDFSHLIDIDRNLIRLQGYSVAATEAQLFASATQTRLERLQELSETLMPQMVLASQSGLDTVHDNIAGQAQQGLKDAISLLNGGVSGRSLFAGVATDMVPLESDTVLLDELKSVLTGLTTAADIMQAAEDWFDDPAGFQALIYRGSSTDLSPIQIASGQLVGLSIKADDPVFRDTLRNLAVSALATDPDLALTNDTLQDLYRLTTDSILANNDELTQMRADLGYAEARIEEAAIRNESARTSLEYARGSLLEADPFETATQLESVQFQLEALYSVTVRASRLSLLAYL